ncbi:MAG: hypothetical protein CMK09_00075 [Ponticaulis sp.]|nr:hypothetical protein [Ponticaulis sp.]|tara:strand:- start:37989 stop:38318 length:330 start_codon:yes stop_codon:yes gene_type:complete
MLPLLVSCGGASAKEELHPVLGKKPPRNVLSKDILALPEIERTAWLHGALTLMISSYASFDQDTSGCLTDWAFLQGNGLEILHGYLHDYKSEPVYAVIHAVAKEACPNV